MKNALDFRRLAVALWIAAWSGLAAAAGTRPAASASPSAPPAAVSAPTSLRVDSAWVRAAPPGSMMLAGYMTLHNLGKTPVRLVSAQSDAFGTVELHQSQLVNGVETMRPAGDQAIAPGASLGIQPGGLHWMLMQPKRELKAGDRVGFRLRFADGAFLDVTAAVALQAPEVGRQ